MIGMLTFMASRSIFHMAIRIESQSHTRVMRYTSNLVNIRYQATFLPGVAKEHNMTYRGTLEELVNLNIRS